MAWAVGCWQPDLGSTLGRTPDACSALEVTSGEEVVSDKACLPEAPCTSCAGASQRERTDRSGCANDSREPSRKQAIHAHNGVSWPRSGIAPADPQGLARSPPHASTFDHRWVSRALRWPGDGQHGAVRRSDALSVGSLLRPVGCRSRRFHSREWTEPPRRLGAATIGPGASWRGRPTKRSSTSTA